MLKSLLYLIFSLLLSQRVRHDINTEDVEDEYDFIIVGAGTTGSTIANRLTENPNVRVLVVEAGLSDNGNPLINIPLNWYKLKGSPYDWNYKIKPQQTSKDIGEDHEEYWPRGKVLGGSSSINSMGYIRGSPHDYNSWEDHGAKGWGWDDVEPYFRKLEGASDPGMSERLGRNGPLKITKRYDLPLTNSLLKTAENLGYTHTNYTDDLIGVTKIISTVYGGMRQNAATAFLYPVLPERAERLHVLLEAMVTKVVINERDKEPSKAVGVTYIKNGKEKFVRARKEVILCAGAIGSPHLLMLSGIGSREHLNEMKINTLVDLPGVGSNLQDYAMVLFFFHTTNMSKDFVLNEKMIEDHEMEYITNGTGPWLCPLGITLSLQLRTRLDEASASTYRRPFPDIQIVFFTAANKSAVVSPKQDPHDAKSVDFLLSVATIHPKSRGSIKLSSPDPNVHPFIDPKYLSNDDDMRVMIEGIRHMERFENSSLFKTLGAKMILPSDCKELHEENAPRSDELYRCLVHAGVRTEARVCCTAKIGSVEDDGAVVDNKLRVYGVEGLRVADASVMPHVTAGLQSTCYMIGEKAADLIKGDWKL